MPKTIFFLVPYPHGEAPSQRFRFEQYIPFLEEQGFRVEVHPFYDYNTWQTLYTEGNFLKKARGVSRSFIKRFGLLFRLREADHIFIHREVAHAGPPVFEWIIAKVLRRKYIYDFDDAIWLPNYSETNARFHWIKAYWKVNYCMKWAYRISAGNAYLADHAGKYNSRVEIIPTTIDTVGYHNVQCDHSEEPVTIGWTGTHTTMRYLEFLVPVLRDLEKDHSFRFLVISNEEPDFTLASLEFRRWKKETEIEDLARIQIGVMPLEQDIWSEGKCGFKGLQYMSLGMATVMSPIGVNITILEHGVNGYLAASTEEWKTALKQLLEDPGLRTKLGQAGRKTVEERYSVDAIKGKYLELFNP
ncbi:MAG: glycosyltransferase family 4 protein [Bacteroidota bacterium]|jgi:glycosyltransferase involved in cell wall biosynthesis